MAQGSVRYTKLPTDTQDEDSNDDEKVAVYIMHHAQDKSDKRLTWFRVMVSLVLLSIALLFIVFEHNEWWPDVNALDEHEEHHHHTGEDEEGDHKDDHHSHSHDHTALYHHAVVLTSSDICSKVGIGLLQDGGNVVDASLASLLCLGVVHPQTAGLGGVFSAILFNSTSRSIKTLRSAMPQQPSRTYGIPSILQGVQELHSNLGSSEWSRLFKEAIMLAREGFAIDEHLGKALKSHSDVVRQSDLRTLFCDASGGVKSVGEIVKNQNLSELLLSVSLNESHFLETQAVKLSEDLSPDERPAFLTAIQHSRGEINDPLIMKEEKYTVLSAGLPFAGLMLSDILERVRQQSLSFKHGADFNSSANNYTVFLNLIQELANTFLAENNSGTTDIFASNTQSSHVGVLDKHGNFVAMSASLNQTWGSGIFLPSSGIVLSSFNTNISNSPFFSFPLVIKITDEEDNDEKDNGIEVLAITGGLTALFNAALLLHRRIDLEMMTKEAISSPLLHLEQRSSLTACLSTILNDSDVYMLLLDEHGKLQRVAECSDHSLSMLLQLHAEHVSAYGAPAASSHANGY